MVFIQNSHKLDTIKVNVDIDMPYMPCDVIGIDVEDSIGNHMQDYFGHIQKHRIMPDGTYVSDVTQEERHESRRAMLERLKREVKEGQGCRLEGYLEVVRIPGNFHVAHHAFNDLLQALHADGVTFDNTFTINHLSFGDLKDKQTIKDRFPETDISNPLDGFTREKGDATTMRVGFFLNAVPSEFEADHLGNAFITEAFQLDATYETDYTYHEDLIIFNYQISPIAIHYTN